MNTTEDVVGKWNFQDDERRCEAIRYEAKIARTIAEADAVITALMQ